MARDTAYEVIHAFNHDGVYYTRENQHLIAGAVAPDVIDQLVQMKMLREVPVKREGSVATQHEALRKTPAAKAYRDEVSQSLDAQGLTGVAEEALSQHLAAVEGEGGVAVEGGAKSSRKHKGGR